MTSRDKERNHRLKIHFGLTIESWEAINSYQNALCFICQRRQKSGKRLATDHSHKTGLVRGLLCSTCNRILGRIERTWDNQTDVILTLERLILFLKDPPATKALGLVLMTFPGRFGTKRHKKYLKQKKEQTSVPLSGTMGRDKNGSIKSNRSNQSNCSNKSNKSSKST